MKPRILVVDDDIDMAWTIGEILTDAGYDVVNAGDGVQALREMRVTPDLPAMILLDMMMPNMDGWQLLAELRKDERLVSIPVVVMTAGRIDEQVARSLGGVGFLRKPFEISTLLETVAALAPADASKDFRPALSIRNQ